MRFVFVPLFLFILIRCARNAWLEYRYEKTRIGDVGADSRVYGWAALIDEWQDPDAWRPLYEDTVLGSASDCNFRIRSHGLKSKHARIFFEDGKVYVERLCGEKERLFADGQIVLDRREVKDGMHIEAAEAEVIVSFRHPMRNMEGDEEE